MASVYRQDISYNTTIGIIGSAFAWAVEGVEQKALSSIHTDSCEVYEVIVCRRADNCEVYVAMGLLNTPY